jgi:phosphoribosylformimino-5-aminoimidazole carboxamide ribotide isomerase
MPHRTITPVAVMDWSAGRLVHAQAGQRTTYVPLETRFAALQNLTAVEIAWALNRHLNIRHFYVADLDALQGHVASGAEELVQSLGDCGWDVWLDQGPRASVPQRRREVDVRSPPRFRPIWGTESFRSPAQLLAYLAADPGRSRGIVSLDLQTAGDQLFWFGHPAGRTNPTEPPFDGDVATARDWSRVSPRALVDALVDRGVQQFVVLNLSDVGGSQWTTGPLLRTLREAFPQIGLVAGGGVRNQTSLQQLADTGVNHVLVGTWLWEQLSTALLTARGYTP